MQDFILDDNYNVWLPSDKNCNILDIGCGDGRVLRFLSQNGFTQILGVDRDLNSLSKVGQLPGVSLERIEADASYLNRHKGKFRLIILRQVLYYIDRRDVVEFMKALRFALADDGLLLIEFFNGSLLSSRFTELKDPFIRTAYTEHSIRSLISSVGLFEWHTGGVHHTKSKFRSFFYNVVRLCWFLLLKFIYILERGKDDQLPKIYAKSILTVAGRMPKST